ncbi:hypothetical protein EVA_13280 [gut metagenome]|uniref:Uncharacterized protein n=1 Tax=gut metagenome TaxID=749906 RepID=J9FVS2_9ZZZZ
MPSTNSIGSRGVPSSASISGHTATSSCSSCRHATFLSRQPL